MDKDCIKNAREHIVEGSYATKEELDEIDEQCLQAVNQAAEYAENSPFPEAHEILEDVYVSYS